MFSAANGQVDIKQGYKLINMKTQTENIPPDITGDVKVRPLIDVTDGTLTANQSIKNISNIKYQCQNIVDPESSR